LTVPANLNRFVVSSFEFSATSRLRLLLAKYRTSSGSSFRLLFSRMMVAMLGMSKLFPF